MRIDWQEEQLNLLKVKKRDAKMLTVQELDKVTEELWETAKNVFTLGEEEKYTFGVGVTLTLMYMNEYDNKENDKHNKPITERFFKSCKNEYEPPLDDTPQPEDTHLES